MWTEPKRFRFQELRTRQEKNALTDTEQMELTLLIDELEAAESRYLAPATERVRQEREAIERQNLAVAALALRKEALVNRLSEFLTEARAERRAIEGELSAVLAAGPCAETEE